MMQLAVPRLESARGARIVSASTDGRQVLFTNSILIGNIFRRSGLKMAGIDEMFVVHGADLAWWTKAPVSIHDSRFIDRVNGWFIGINKFAPEKTMSIMRAVLAELAVSGSIVSADDRNLALHQIQRIDAHLNPPTSSQQQGQLDSRVIAAAGSYWASGHYTKAVQNAYVALITAVAVKINRPDQDGDGLMRHAFSKDSPILVISKVASEQRGYMDLFAGSVLAIRNPLSHTSDEVLSADEARELLGFASYLFRVLDRANPPTS